MAAAVAAQHLLLQGKISRRDATRQLSSVWPLMARSGVIDAVRFFRMANMGLLQRAECDMDNAMLTSPPGRKATRLPIFPLRLQCIEALIAKTDALVHDQQPHACHKSSNIPPFLTSDSIGRVCGYHVRQR